MNTNKISGPASEPKCPKPIALIEEMDHVIGEIMEIIAKMEQTLHPVLIAPTPQTCEEKNPNHENTSPINESLQASIDKGRQLKYRVEELISRIDL